jgi:uncharacterized protein (DUF433 family)
MAKIITNPEIMLGKPIIRGTRITVEIILRKLSEGANFEDILKMYPNITIEDIYVAIDYAANTIANEEILAA